MKTFATSLLALGLLATAASAQMCSTAGYGQQRPSHARATAPIEQPQAPAAAPQAPAEPAPAPAPAAPQR